MGLNQREQELLKRNMPGWHDRKNIKKPRRLNTASVPMLLLLAGLAYAAATFGPVLLMRYKAQRIVSAGVFEAFQFAHLRGSVRAAEERKLRTAMIEHLRGLGVTDHDLEVTFEQSKKDFTVTASFVFNVEYPLLNRNQVMHFAPSSTTGTDRPFD